MTDHVMTRPPLSTGERPVQGRLPDPEQSEGEAKALLRALPYTRLTDYLMVPADARELVWRVATGESWPAVGREIAERQAARSREAVDAGRRVTAIEAARAALAAFNGAQVSINDDSDLKRELYAAFTAAVGDYAAVSPLVIEPLTLEHDGATLAGWLVLPASGKARGAVVTWGGFSGWGASFLGGALALAERGLACILADAPGQGATRITHGVYLDGAAAIEHLRAFVDHAVAEPRIGGSVGIQGNSFGGLLAARYAATDTRVAACIINGAPSRLALPEFRTAREQIIAFTGAASPEAADAVLAELAFDPDTHRIAADTLVLRGGADALVADDDVTRFLAGTASGRALVWPDGEHTLYNHAEERNALVADWFVDRLAGDEPAS